MKHLFLFLLSYSILPPSFSQYKNDNIAFKTIDWSQVCKTLKDNKGYLLLDVRSSGEFSDTSSFTELNIGHLKDAMNISVQELGKRLGEIKSYKDKPVIIYCSHSQRSRRAGKMLSDSGFVNLFNINGGMTALYYSGENENPCLKQLLVARNSYNVLSATEIADKLDKKGDKVFILDVRSDSAFRHISSDPKSNAMGTLTGSVNIPFNILEANLARIPHDKEIIITDLNGREAAKAASLLRSKSYENVSMLLEGIERWLAEENNSSSNKSQYYQPAVKYQLVNSFQFAKWVKEHPDGLILDVRTTDAFTNKHKDSYRNIGHVKNAKNIPAAEIEAHLAELNDFKNKPLIIYSFGGSPDTHMVAQTLEKNGFTNVLVLITGIFDIRWTAHNIKGLQYLQDLVTDVPEINQ